MKGPTAIRELQVFCDLPAEAAIREAGSVLHGART